MLFHAKIDFLLMQLHESFAQNCFNHCLSFYVSVTGFSLEFGRTVIGTNASLMRH